MLVNYFKSTVNQSNAMNCGWWCSRDRLLTNTASNSLHIILFNILLGTVLNKLIDIQMFRHSQYRKTQIKMSVIYCSSGSDQNSIVCFAPKWNFTHNLRMLANYQKTMITYDHSDLCQRKMTMFINRLAKS